MSAKKSPDKGVMSIADKNTGREYKVAVGAVPRIEWLAQLQDSGVGAAEINLAIAVTRFINGKCGHTFAGDEEIGKLAGIKERTARQYIASLIKDGHLIRIRRGRATSALYLVIADRRKDCLSKDAHDRQEVRRSKNTSTGEDTTFDRRNHDISTGESDFASASNQSDCGPITQRITQRSNSANNARVARETETNPPSGDFFSEDDASKKKQPRGKKFEIDALFESRFWAIWPHKVGKPAARKAFEVCWREIDAIAAGVERYIATKPPDRNWLNPATFLNQRRWEDEPAQAVNGFANGGTSPARRGRQSIWEISGLTDPYKGGR